MIFLNPGFSRHLKATVLLFIYDKGRRQCCDKVPFMSKLTGVPKSQWRPCAGENDFKMNMVTGFGLS